MTFKTSGFLKTDLEWEGETQIQKLLDVNVKFELSYYIYKVTNIRVNEYN